MLDAREQRFFCGVVAVLVLSGTAGATIDYGTVTPGTPGIGPGLATPDMVPGKEYSHDMDEEITAVGVAPDPHQIIAWDGSGGVKNGLDFSPPVLPTPLVDTDIDAIANHIDYLFNALISDDAHLIFSVDKDFVVYSPAGVPSPGVLPEGTPPGVVLKNGNTIGGSGEVSYELGVFGGANGAEDQGLWADQAAVNGMPLPIDVDGLEVWGPEPAEVADTDKFSLRVDAATGIGGPAVSVWNDTGTAYIFLSEIEAAVTALLGDIPTTVEPDRLNLDALMVQDSVGSSDEFERDPAGGGDVDRIIFSIDQIEDPADPDGYYATGSELFVLDAAGGVSFLTHGGHDWDHAYGLSTFGFGEPGGNQNYGVFDIDAIEAVSQFVVPEPCGWLLFLPAVAILMKRCRNR